MFRMQFKYDEGYPRHLPFSCTTYFPPVSGSWKDPGQRLNGESDVGEVGEVISVTSQEPHAITMISTGHVGGGQGADWHHEDPIPVSYSPSCSQGALRAGGGGGQPLSALRHGMTHITWFLLAPHYMALLCLRHYEYNR